MKMFITPSYTFTPGASGVGTVNLSGIGSFEIKHLVAIINQTKGVVIYATGSTALRYTNVATTTLTLFFDTTTMSSGDTLQVIYDDQTSAQVVSFTTTPLPSGASTSSLQTTGNSSLSSIDGKLPTLVSGKTPVISQDQVQTGSFAEDLSVSATPETFTAPAGAFACLIEADDTNTTNLRVVMGGTASPTSGKQFQPGRDAMYYGGSNISYCAESSTCKICVQWFIKT